METQQTSGFLFCPLNLPITMQICGFCGEQVCKQSLAIFCIHFVYTAYLFSQKSQYRNAGLEAGVNFSLFIVDNTPIGPKYIINVKT